MRFHALPVRCGWGKYFLCIALFVEYPAIIFRCHVIKFKLGPVGCKRATYIHKYISILSYNRTQEPRRWSSKIILNSRPFKFRFGNCIELPTVRINLLFQRLVNLCFISCNQFKAMPLNVQLPGIYSGSNVTLLVQPIFGLKGTILNAVPPEHIPHPIPFGV